MALSLGESGGGYPRTQLRITDSPDRSGLDTQPARGGGWFSNLLDASREIAEARRRREEEEKRREQEELKRRQAEDEMNARQEQEQLRAEKERVAQERMNDPVWSWAHSSEGNRFLSSGGAKKVDYNAFARDPDRFLAENDSLREFGWGFGGELADKGVPSAVTERLAQYATTEEGRKHFKYIGVRDYGGPVQSVVKGVTGSNLAAGVASMAMGAIPVVGPALVGAEMGLAPGSDKMDRRLAADAAGAVGTALVMGRPINALETGAANAAAARFGKSAVTEIAAKAGTRAALNVAEDVPLSGAQAVAYGADASSGDFWKALGLQAGISAAAGAAVPVTGAGLRALPEAISAVPPELRASAAAYLVAKQMGADEDEARTYAVMAAGGVSLGRRGLSESLKTGFGMTDVLARAQGVAESAPRVDLPEGPNIMYYGTVAPWSGEIRVDGFVTPSRTDAEAFARGSSRLTGQPAQVIAFESAEGATVPSRMEGIAASRGARQIVDPAGLREVGRSGVEMRPAMGAGIEPGDIPPRPGEQTLVNKGDDLVPEDYAPPEIPPTPGKQNIVQPRPADDIPIAKPPMGEDFLRKADEQLDSHRATDAYKAFVARVRGAGDDGTSIGSARDKLASLLNIPTHLVGAVDPATKFARPVLRSVVAASNFLNSQAIELVGRQRQIISDLRPLIGETAQRRLGREAVRLAPAAAGAAASIPFGGPETETGRKLIAAGAITSYGLHMGDAGVRRSLPFDSIKYTSALNSGVLPGAGIDARDLPSALKSGQGKLAHIILHPEDFDLAPDQLRAAKAAQGTLQASFAGMQEFQEWAGRQVTQDTLEQGDARLFQWFTKDSVEKVLGKDYFSARSGKPGFAADLPVEQQRRLGKNIVDAMIKHPELKLDGDVVGLMMRDLDQKARVSANAIIVRGLTSGTEGADGFVKDRTSALGDKLREAVTLRDSLAPDDPNFASVDSRVGNLMKELREAEAAEAALGVDKTWGEIPGIDGHKFAPEILEAVRNLAVERNGEFGGLLDRVTSNIRTAMFTADLSAWTMQGWMLAMRDPRGAVKAMPHVLAASLLGDRYTAEWIKDNYMLSRKWAARGLVNGRMVDELAFGSDVAKMPLIHGIESRGFSNALPVFRILMAEHMSRMETMASLATEGGALRSFVGNLGGNDFVRLSQAGAAYGPLAAGIGTAVATDGGFDEKDWQDWFALALGAGGTLAMSKVLDGAAKSAYERATPAQRAAAETRVAKDINRVSGIMNKPQMGISQKQAQIERTFLFRSPALLRNTLIMAKLALTNTGPEGAMARVYLLQTGVMLAGASALVKYAMTGEMDSFNPNDPNSVLNPAHFARAGLGATGKASASNPLASLARAIFYHQSAEGEPGKGLEMPGGRDLASGLIQFGENRLTDVVGQAYKPGVDLLREGISGRPIENDSPLASGIKAAGTGDLGGVGAALGRMSTPLPIQEAAAAGAFRDIGIEGDPNYNNRKERIFGPLATMGGFNASPETRSQEAVRRTDAAIREMFPNATDFNQNGSIDRRDLNDADRRRFDDSPVGQEIATFREETRALRPEEEVSQVDLYFAARDKALDTHVAKLRSLENAASSGAISKTEYRAAYQAEQARYIQSKDQIEQDWADQAVGRPVFNPDTGKAEEDMSVVDYVNRGTHPEDVNVDEWFRLYDKAVGPNGELDFDRLESLQEDYKASLAPDELAYLEERLASFKEKGVTDSEGNTVALPTLREYEDVKEAAKPFWEIADQQFATLRERDPFFAQFANYNAFKKAILDAAEGDAVIAAAIEDGLKKRHPWLKRFSKDVERAQRTMRAQNVDLDVALAEWYERAPVNPLAYIARQAGDTQFDQQGMSFVSGKREISQRQKLQLAQQYGLTSPSFSDAFGYR